MKQLGITRIWAALPAVVLACAWALPAKDKPVSAEFDAPATKVFDAVYRYAQHHGTIKWADEKRFTLSGSMSIPGGKWDWRKDFDCTISVEAADGGKKSAVNVVGTFPAKQQSLVGALGEGPAAKVLRGIREEFDTLPDEAAKKDAQASGAVAPNPASASAPTNPQSSKEPVEVTFASNPAGAAVSFSGVEVGHTPFATKVESGTYRIKMTLAGYADWTGEMTVEAGKPSTVVAQMARPQ